LKPVLHDFFEINCKNAMIAPLPVRESEDQDAQMMARVADGEIELFDGLVERNESRVRGLVSRMRGGPVADSEDLTQQVFMQAYRARNSYCPSAKFTTWLFVITRNVVLNSQRSAARRHETELLAPDRVEASRRVRGELSAWYDPVDAIIREETRRVVAEAIEQLPDRQRRAIMLVGLDGCRYKVAAQQMMVTEKAIKSLVHRAKVNLRLILELENPSRSAG
jgi:RNA polymerase sigma-70 factor (ECF subfamily)